MSVQKKLWPTFSHEFWQDPRRSLSFMIQDLVKGHDIAGLARKLREHGIDRVTDSLIYKWCNPNDERIPNALALILLIKITENCLAVERINKACGLIAVPDYDYRVGIKEFDAEFEKRERMRKRESWVG